MKVGTKMSLVDNKIYNQLMKERSLLVRKMFDVGLSKKEEDWLLIPSIEVFSMYGD